MANKLVLIKLHHHHCIVSMVTIVIVMIITLITLVMVLMILVVIIVIIIAIVIVVLIITKDQGGSHLRAASANATITRLAG